MSVYTNEWNENLAVGKDLFEQLRADANKAHSRADKPMIGEQKSRVGQQKQKKGK